MASIKEALLAVVEGLNNVPLENKKTLETIKTSLKQGTISDSSKDKERACLFIMSLFCHHPNLMTPANKKLLEHFSKQLDLERLINSQSMRPSRGR